jgi:hypothetical protein
MAINYYRQPKTLAPSRTNIVRKSGGVPAVKVATEDTAPDPTTYFGTTGDTDGFGTVTLDTSEAARVAAGASRYGADKSAASSKYKTDITNYTKGLNEVLGLRPVFYKGKTDGDTQFAGLIAEEVHELGLTEFVQYAPDGSPDALSYQNMIALAFKAIQELKSENDNLKSRLEVLEQA